MKFTFLGVNFFSGDSDLVRFFIGDLERDLELDRIEFDSDRVLFFSLGDLDLDLDLEIDLDLDLERRFSP